MQIKLSSVLVANQDQALEFYTQKLGFVAKTDIPMGEFRWLTVVSPEAPDDVELVLEPVAFPPARTYQSALHDAGIPATAFEVRDIDAEVTRLTELGVVIRSGPTDAGPTRMAIVEDTCGNLLQLYQVIA